MLASTNIFLIEWLPEDCFCKHLCPQGEFQFPPASLGSSPSSASGYDSGFFQITVSTLGRSSCENFYEHFGNGELSDFSESKPCWLSKPDSLGTHPASAGTPDLRDPTFYSLWKLCGSFPTVVPYLGYGSWFYCISSLPSLIPYGFFFYIFSFRR